MASFAVTIDIKGSLRIEVQAVDMAEAEAAAYEHIMEMSDEDYREHTHAVPTAILRTETED